MESCGPQLLSCDSQRVGGVLVAWWIKIRALCEEDNTTWHEVHACLQPARFDKVRATIMVQDNVPTSSAPSDSMGAKALAIATSVRANKHSKLKLFVHLLRFFESFAVAVTCYFVIEQTKEMVQQTNENRVTSKVAVTNFLREHYQTINKVLAEQEKARSELGLSINEVIGYMLISDYDTIYQMHNEGMIEDGKWKVLDHFIRQQMNDSKWQIKKLWRAPGNRGRSPDFQAYVEACVYSDYYDSWLTTRQLIKEQKTRCPDLLEYSLPHFYTQFNTRHDSSVPAPVSASN
jgi:hypothetical protein